MAFSGLTDKVKASTLTEEQAEAEICLSAAVRSQGCCTHVRQQHWSGSKVPRALHAQAGGVLSLPQCRCEHPEGAGQRWKPEAYSSFKPGAERLWQTFMSLSTSWHITEPTSWPSERGQGFPGLVALAREAVKARRAYHRRLHASIAGNPERNNLGLRSFCCRLHLPHTGLASSLPWQQSFAFFAHPPRPGSWQVSV